MNRPPVAKSNARRDQTEARKYNGDDRYQQPAWRKTSLKMKTLNPICQKIPNTGGGAGLYAIGEQCHNPATICHHLISPKQRPDLFLVPSNLVCLCAQDHPDAEGTPDWVVGIDYVATELPKWNIS
jgi:hypothetical protein